MNSAVFYHAGCPVCVNAEQQLLSALDSRQFQVSVVHLGENKDRIADAEQAGVISVPALVLDGQVYHINFGASLDDVKGASA
ncbi:thioredoxin family protein [Marinobacter sp. SS21]|uniref:thioredoxin family protein n=1 Tax=Marinobacter sp. SS21 TaxID=2979460 RepID=UPI0023311467|nr:thioredoxin family protein [Marinobacter sp. SS21]MDC0661392.1 thioredoxin family protein [Marinobacter sp. SS21]